MGSFCGWSGVHTGTDTPQQTINLMLDQCRGNATTECTTDCGERGAVGVCHGLYRTSHYHGDGIRAVITGSPVWDDPAIAETAGQHGDAPALARAYRDHGKGLLSRLHGPFALALLDEDSALAAIDRIGIHSLSYALGDGVFVFSTSTGSVVRHPRVSREIDPQAIFNYIYFYDIPSPGTVYRNVEKLLPAQYIHYRNGALEKNFYWQLNYDESNRTSFQSRRRELHETLKQCVASSASDGPVATFLSGGTDSSTVTGFLAGLQDDPVDTYSIGFGADGFDEMQYARLAVKRFAASAHEYYLKPDDVLEAIPLIAGTYDEPFANESAVPTYFCARQAASDGIRVMLAGDGGDEIFGGNERYAKQLVFEHYGRVPRILRKGLVEPLAGGFPGGDAIMPVRKLRSYIRQASIPLPERMESYNFIYRQPLAEMFHPDFIATVDPDVPAAMLRDAYTRADTDHTVNRMLHLDMKFTLADNDLRKVSRMCEVAGVEVRYPLLDEALVDFSCRLPVHYKVRGRRLRWFFKEALKDFLPREIITKSKHGFGLPFGIWAMTHEPLRELVDETLQKFADRGYLQPSYIRNIRNQHASNHATYFGKMIWVMMMLELWLQEHADG
jgi:asparagine synthase (glutamine-hydrolysing)